MNLWIEAMSVAAEIGLSQRFTLGDVHGDYACHCDRKSPPDIEKRPAVADRFILIHFCII